MTPVPDVVDFPRGHSSAFLILPQRVQLWEASQGEQNEVPLPRPSQRQAQERLFLTTHLLPTPRSSAFQGY